MGGDKYLVNVPLTAFNGSVFTVNKERWDEMPAVLQRILIDGQVLATTLSADSQQVGWRDMAKLLADGTVKFVAVDPEVDKPLADFQAKDIEALPSVAPAGVSDAATFIDQYKTLVEKWTGIVTELGYPNDRKGVTDPNVFITNWQAQYDWAPFNGRLREELAKDETAAN